MSPAITRLHGRARSRHVLVTVLPQRVHQLLFEAAISNEHLIGLGVWLSAAPLLVAAAALMYGSAVAIVMVLSMAGLPVALVARWSGRRSVRLVQSLPALIDGVGRALRSGASLQQALHEVVADESTVATEELGGVLASVEAGEDLTHALATWAKRRPLAEVRVVTAALGVVLENQAGTARALAGVSDTLRDRRALSDEIRALTSQAALSMQALVFLPVGFLAIDTLGEGGALAYLTSESIGRFCLFGGITLNLVGWKWMRSTIDRQVPT